jgi:hypothetical protein
MLLRANLGTRYRVSSERPSRRTSGTIRQDIAPKSRNSDPPAQRAAWKRSPCTRKPCSESRLATPMTALPCRRYHQTASSAGVSPGTGMSRKSKG